MPEAKENDTKPFDPLEPFRGIRDAYLDAMSKTMIEAVNTEPYAEATGAMLDYCLSASAPFRDLLQKSMAQALQQLSLPSRGEVAALAERFTHVEMRLDDLDAKIDRLLGAVAKIRQDSDAKTDPKPTPPTGKRT